LCRGEWRESEEKKSNQSEKSRGNSGKLIGFHGFSF
jgi:hypothetical protein